MPWITLPEPKYPLTESEKKWLEGKSDADYPAPCVRIGKRGLFDMRYCLRACEGNSASSPKYCPIASDFRDAAEFEARVAREATARFYLLNCGRCERRISMKVCKLSGHECLLMKARLEVEEEMENGRTV